MVYYLRIFLFLPLFLFFGNYIPYYWAVGEMSE